MVICLTDYDNATLIYNIPHDVATTPEKCQKVVIDDLPSAIKQQELQKRKLTSLELQKIEIS